MQFHKPKKPELRITDFNLVPFVDVIFLLLIFYLFSSAYVAPSNIRIKVPKAILSEIVKEDSAVILVTSENTIYFNNNLITMEELKKELSQPLHKNRPILIKTDQRASLSRVIELWDLCRSLGVENINLATD